jgi:hypothetical protein
VAIMETKPHIPRAILVGVQIPGVDDIAHAASIEELGRLVKTLGYEVAGTLSQKRDEIDGGTVLGKGRLEELSAMTGGTGVVGSMAIPRKSKARERFEDADEKKPNAAQTEPDPKAPPRPEFVIVDHDLSPSQARHLERATGAQVLDRTGVIVEIFHRHAHSREAKLQVEMARLKYIAPRQRESSASGEFMKAECHMSAVAQVDFTPVREVILLQSADHLDRFYEGGWNAANRTHRRFEISRRNACDLCRDICQPCNRDGVAAPCTRGT